LPDLSQPPAPSPCSRPAAATETLGSQLGSHQAPMSGKTEPQPASISPARLHIRRHKATYRHPPHVPSNNAGLYALPGTDDRLRAVGFGPSTLRSTPPKSCSITSVPLTSTGLISLR
jgi:hypothetical protein